MYFFEIKQLPGFRINFMDIVLILFSIFLSYFIHFYIPVFKIYGLPCFFCFMFFLFCNVFRFGSFMEVLWIFFTIFVLLEKNLDTALILSFLFGISLTIPSIFLGWYHGLFWQSFRAIHGYPDENIIQSNTKHENLRNLYLSFLKNKPYSKWIN